MNRRLTRFILLAMLWLAIMPRLLLAHGGGEESDEGPHNLHEMWHTWGWEPGSLIGLAVMASLYGAGVYRMWRTAGIGHGIHRWEASCFAAGWVTLFIALISPIHPLGQVLFSAHMTQHELIMLVAAPLMILGRPTAVAIRGLPRSTAVALGHFSNTGTWQRFWGTISNPLVAWMIHAVVLWAWHAPTLFQATLHSEWVHAAQHLSFLLSALLFWWSMIHGRRTAMSYGAAVLYLFTTAIHSGLLGALLTFARTTWYPEYAHRTEQWGLSPFEDQQVGGLIMWVPACVVYIIAGLVMFAGWLRESERRVLKREASSAAAAAAGFTFNAKAELP